MESVPDPFRERRNDDGVLPCEFQGEIVPMILRHEDVRRAAKDWKTYSSNAPFRVPIPSEEDVRTMRQLPVETDPPDHTDYREIVEPFFRRARDPEMIAQVEALLEEMVRDALTKDSIEVVRHFALPVQSRALAYLLNVPESEVADVVETALKECQFSKAYRVHRPFVEFKMSFPKSKITEALRWKEVLDQKLARWIPTSPIYLDYNATTPLDPRCLETMTPYFQKQFGNSISTHQVGVQASKAVEHARKQVAQLLNVLPEEIFFTSGATESNNWILRSLSKMNAAFFSSPTEHKSVLETLKFLEKLKVAKNIYAVSVLIVNAKK